MKLVFLTISVVIFNFGYSQTVNKDELKAAGGELEAYSHIQSTANVLYGLGIGFTTGSFLAADDNGVPNVPMAVGGSVLAFVGWMIDRKAHKHVKRAGYHLMSADSGVGVKLVF